MDRGFAEWLDLQHKLQVESFGVDPRVLSEEEAAGYIQWNVLAATDELHEALQEVRWKPWATPYGGFVDRDRYVKELVDLLHFVANLLLVANVTGEELEVAYRSKHDVNAKRQEEGYDGVQVKCVNCSRDLEEAGVSTFRVRVAEGVTVEVTQCDACFHELWREDTT